MDLTISTFVVLHTPVTFAPNALAICTAQVPTPPEAPMISTSYPRRLLEGEVCGLGRELVLASTHVLGVGALSDAEHLITWLEAGHVLAECLHNPGHVRADDGVLGRAEAIAREAYRVG